MGLTNIITSLSWIPFPSALRLSSELQPGMTDELNLTYKKRKYKYDRPAIGKSKAILSAKIKNKIKIIKRPRTVGTSFII